LKYFRSVNPSMALDPRIRIMHVVQSLEVGGLENGVVNLLNRLDPKAFNHTICCLTHGGRLVGRIQGENIKVVEVGLRADKFRFPVVTLRRFIRKFAPEILHTRGWSTVDGIIAARLAGVARVIHGEHGREATDPHGLNRKRNLIRRCLSPLVDHFVTVSEDLRSWLTERVGISPDKVTTIHNGVDTEKFAPLSAERCAKSLAPRLRGEVGQESPVDRNRSAARAVLRQALCFPPESVVIGTVG